MNKFDFSPELKKAMEEITEILEKHDVAGAFALYSPGFGEYLFHLNASYSCIEHPKKNNVKIKREINEKRTIMETANMLAVLKRLSGKNFLELEYIKEAFDSKMDLSEGESF